MGVEIERKFLVVGDGWRQQVTKATLFRQGYLSTNAKATVRVRSRDDSTAHLTLKGKLSGTRRAEYEYPIPIEDARELLAMAAPHVIEKTRHLVPAGQLTWEVDVFAGHLTGLVMAEIELSHEDQVFERPDWLGAEVTEDARYYNASLSRSAGPPSITVK